MTLFHTFAITFMAFFAIMNPSSTLPVYLALINKDDPNIAKEMARRACLTAFCIVAVFALAGKVLFHLFGISLAALQIGGGALIFSIGFDMIQGAPSDMQHPSQDDQEAAKQDYLSAAISPLAVPMMAGPGSIATAMNFSAHDNFLHTIVTIIAYGSLCAITYFIFLGGKPLVRFLGQNMINVITRLMGLILAVIGVQMIIVGLKAAFPSLLG